MAKNKPAKIGRPTKGEGPKLSNPDEVERLLVEGEVVPDEHGEAKRVWLTQRDVAARLDVYKRQPLHHCDERGEEAILLVAVAAPGHEVGDDLLRVVEPGEHRVLGFGCLERLL